MWCNEGELAEPFEGDDLGLLVGPASPPHSPVSSHSSSENVVLFDAEDDDIDLWDDVLLSDETEGEMPKKSKWSRLLKKSSSR